MVVFFQDRTCDDGSRSDSSSISDGYIANNRRANADVDIVTQLGSGKIRRRVANAIGTVQYAVLTDASISIHDDVAVMVDAQSFVENIFGDFNAESAS